MVNVKVTMKETNKDGGKSNTCDQYEYTSFQAGDLKRDFKTHSGEKSNKCNQCDYASSHVGNLRTHLKTHSGVLALQNSL